MSQKYVVKVLNLFANLLEVTANNEEDAKRQAKLAIGEQEQLQHFYETTLPEQYWSVLEKDEFEQIQSEVINKAKENELENIIEQIK